MKINPETKATNVYSVSKTVPFIRFPVHLLRAYRRVSMNYTVGKGGLIIIPRQVAPISPRKFTSRRKRESIKGFDENDKPIRYYASYDTPCIEQSLSLSLSLPLVIALIKRTLNFPRGRGRGWKNIRRNERVTIDKSE